MGRLPGKLRMGKESKHTEPVLDGDDDDARVVHVTATNLAKKLLGRYDAASEEILSNALSGLTVKERAAVTTALPALCRLQAILTAPPTPGSV